MRRGLIAYCLLRTATWRSSGKRPELPTKRARMRYEQRMTGRVFSCEEMYVALCTAIPAEAPPAYRSDRHDQLKGW